MASTSNDDNDARASMEAARMEVLEAEKQIQSIKASLRALGGNSNESQAENSFKITIVKVSGLPESAEPIMKFQLSSPIEEVTLTKVGEEATVKGVDTSLATMTCTMTDKDIPLGTSASLEVAPLCMFDMDDPTTVVNELDIAIVTDDVTTTEESTEETAADETIESYETKTEESKESTDSEKEESYETTTEEAKESTEGEKEESTETVKDETTDAAEETVVAESVEEAVVETKSSEDGVEVVSAEKDEKEEATAKDETTKTDAVQPLLPICTVQVKVEFEPSKKDQMDALYAQLNEASKRKSKAIDALRKSATAVGRTAVPKEPTAQAVKSGFLNAKKKKEIPLWKRWYEKTIGPKSMMRMIAPVFKNYALFFGAVAFFHYRGGDMALEPPV